MTETKPWQPYPIKGVTGYETVTPENLTGEFGNNIFRNLFTRNTWFFIENQKSEKIVREFNLSDVQTLQYETRFQEKDEPMVLPKKIIRQNIKNMRADAVLIKYEGKHDSEEFREEFLTTTINQYCGQFLKSVMPVGQGLRVGAGI